MTSKTRVNVVPVFSALLTMLFLSGTAGYCQDKWTGDITAGYTVSNGNTKKSALNGSGNVKKNFDKIDVSAKGDIFTSSSKGKMDDQKWLGQGRGAYNFGHEDRWFTFAQVTVDHDRFSDIDIRTVPSAGLGYWLVKQDTFKWSVEGGLGYEVTNFRSEKATQKSMVGIGKTHLEKTLIKKSKVTEDFTIIPTFNGNGYRINNEVEFTNPINDMLSLSIKYISDYNSAPPPDKKKMDTRLVTGVKYAF